jgi:hypothetical protein
MVTGLVDGTEWLGPLLCRRKAWAILKWEEVAVPPQDVVTGDIAEQDLQRDTDLRSRTESERLGTLP